MQFYIVTVRNRKRATLAASHHGPHGVPASGRIVKIMVGQGHGFIRLTDDREVYFHRADLEAGTSINELAIGDTLVFDRVDDAVSGPRAVHVRRAPVLVAGCRAAMHRDDHPPADSGTDRGSSEGFDRDEPPEVADQPTHRGHRDADSRSRELTRRREPAVIPPASTR
jgi:cold shock CspA family protein